MKIFSKRWPIRRGGKFCGCLVFGILIVVLPFAMKWIRQLDLKKDNYAKFEGVFYSYILFVRKR
ncbi:hypothetical protein [Ferviditalea candida]|uniref:Uncharacterized protein n=1 Tax=Ferviditalea candida TaxID=3108399 RepID=A0ABU5ZFA2_9BACL|nr:hypothetical protein [Paenibacillaceae bacterium T2]